MENITNSEAAFLDFVRAQVDLLPDSVLGKPLKSEEMTVRKFNEDSWEWTIINKPTCATLYKMVGSSEFKYDNEIAIRCARIHLEDGILSAPKMTGNDGKVIKRPNPKQISGAFFTNFRLRIFMLALSQID